MVVGIFPSLSKDDHEDDEVDKPCISFVDKNSGQANEGNAESDNSNNDDAHRQGNVAVRNSVQGETASNTANCSPSELLHGIEQGDKLVRPPAEAEA